MPAQQDLFIAKGMRFFTLFLFSTLGVNRKTNLAW